MTSISAADFGKASASNASGVSGIESLPDPILAKIFSLLPLTERLHISEVCSRWHDVTRLDWLDVVDMDLTPIPSPNIGAILRLSPNIQTVLAVRRFLILNDLTEHYQTEVTSVKLYDVKMGLASVTGDERHTVEYRNLLAFMEGAYRQPRSEAEWRHKDYTVFCDDSPNEARGLDLFASALNRYFEKLPQLEELVLHSLRASDLQQVPITSIIPFSIHAPQLNTVTRLQLSGSGTRDLFNADLLSESLSRLQQLECLVLHVTLICLHPGETERDDPDREPVSIFDALESLKNLRELSLRTHFRDNTASLRTDRDIAEVALQLPKLEVLFLIDQLLEPQVFKDLCTTHPSLKVLVFAGTNSDFLTLGLTRVPVRKFQLSASPHSLPFLHVFAGCAASRFVSFMGSAAEETVHITVSQELRIHHAPIQEYATAKIVRFDESIQEFLQKDEIAEILDEVWIAKMITETAAYDHHLW